MEASKREQNNEDVCDVSVSAREQNNKNVQRDQNNENVCDGSQTQDQNNEIHSGQTHFLEERPENK